MEIGDGGTCWLGGGTPCWIIAERTADRLDYSREGKADVLADVGG